MRSEIGRRTTVEEREDEKRRKTAAATEDDEVGDKEYEMVDVRDHGRFGIRRRSVFTLLAWDSGELDSTHRGFNFNRDTVIDGIKDLCIHPQNRFFFLLSLSKIFAFL